MKRTAKTSPTFDTSSQDQPKTGAPEVKPRLPHERDESARATGTHEKPARTGSTIEQAGEDVKDGLIDTERRGIPSDLPGPKARDRER